EHIILVWDEVGSEFHNCLIQLYLERVQVLMKEYLNSLPEDESPVAAGNEEGELGEFRNKLLNFLEISSNYEPDRLISDFPFDGLLEERAVLLGRMGKHEQALFIYVHILQNIRMAEEYCHKHYDRLTDGNKDVYLSLLRMYLSPPDVHCLGPIKMELSEPQANLQAALQVLELHHSKLNTTKAINLLPANTQIREIRVFLESILEENAKKKRFNQVLKSLLQAEFLRVQEERIFHQQVKCIVTEEKTCRVCKKKIGNRPKASQSVMKVTRDPRLDRAGRPGSRFDEKAYLAGKQLKAGEDPYREHAFNQQESDRLSSERSIRDTRHYRCAALTFDPDLPATSIIITFHNEARSTLLRTVKSVLLRSPPSLIQEVILVDDFSSDPEDCLLLTQIPKVRCLRNAKREGLIRSRVRGAESATASILTFLDSHCEVNTEWLQPMLQRVKEAGTGTHVLGCKLCCQSLLSQQDPQLLSIAERVELRRKLNCNSFLWYLENVYPELQIPAKEASPSAVRQNGRCLESLGQDKLGDLVVSVGECRVTLGSLPLSQEWVLSGPQIRQQDSCLTITAYSSGSKVTLELCNTKDNRQKWKLKGPSIQHQVSGLCLDSHSGLVAINQCRSELASQKWEIQQVT
ncbi:Vam6/Vps39-like protein, partial [Acipenser ruthenus]